MMEARFKQTEIKKLFEGKWNKMIVPSSETLEIFDAFLRKIYNKVQDNNEQSDILAEIRDALLPKLRFASVQIVI